MFSNKEEFLNNLGKKKDKFPFEKLLDIHKSLNEYNVLSHVMYLELNKGYLDEETIQFHNDVIKRLKEIDDVKIKDALKIIENNNNNI